MQNVGAYGQEVSETIESVEVFDLKDNQVRELCQEACGFHYRSSIFNTTERGRFIILKVAYALTPAGQPHLDYADLKRHFEGRETSPSLRELREAVRDIRTRKGMLIVDGDPDSRSAGSFSRIRCISRPASRPGTASRRSGLNVAELSSTRKQKENLGRVAGRTLRISSRVHPGPRGNLQ